MTRNIRALVLSVALAAAALMLLMTAVVAMASPPYPEGPADSPVTPLLQDRAYDRRPASLSKSIDQPNRKDYLRIRERQRLLEAGQVAEANALAQTGTDRVLVILVEFGGTDVFTWTEGVSDWDPLGIADPDEYTGVVGDCSNIITQTTVFTYSGPLHNTMERPRSPDDRSGNTIWTEDFSNEWFGDFMFGSGVVFSYTMQDDTPVFEDFTGQSVTDYYDDMSGGMYTVTGDIIGWVPVDHSTWYYDADQCPGARSGVSTSRGAIPGAGTARTLVKDALDAVNAISDTIPGFDWANYDLDDDGIIDRLWVVHSGYGEEDSTTLLNRVPVSGTTPLTDTFYGEAAVWSHSSQVTPPYSVTQDIAAGPYIMMPENGGIGVFAHESGHNLGADDLYAYGSGETSTGFWSLMADDWTGHPIGFEPPAVDPWHLDRWGWLDPYLVDDPTAVHEVTLGQASRFPGGVGVYRGAKIPLEDGVLELPVPVWDGVYYWWGGKKDLSNARMTSAAAIDLSGKTAITLSFDLVYDIEDEWDFLWIQVSADAGATWDTITNTNTQCVHDPGWIGELYGFPEDLCGAGLGGFYGYNANWPDPEVQEFDLSSYAGDNIVLRFWYMTDWASLYSGAFVDNVVVEADAVELFSDDAEGGDAKWVYQDPWMRSDGWMSFTHNLYLQWRNVGETGGYDSALGDERWRFGPANTGLLVWYNSNFYTDNEIYGYLEDEYGFGPKGRMLVIDSHPTPYRSPYVEPVWLGLEHTNLTSRGLMRDAPFSLLDTVDFTYTYPYHDQITPTLFSGRPSVSSFHDAFGYYPGVASEGDGTYWCTVDWDASAAVPAKSSYSVAGGPDYPGYHLQYVDGGWWGFWEAGAGGTGDPRDDNAQYGWHVEILEQADDMALVRIWNSAVYVEYGPTPADISAAGVYTLTYWTVLENQGGLDPVNGTVTMTLPSAANLVSTSPGGASEAMPEVVWTGEPLDAGVPVTFTAILTVAVEVGDPALVLEASVDWLDDGSELPPQHHDWVTYISLYGVDAAVIGPDFKMADGGTTVTYTVRVTNTGVNTDTFGLAALGSWAAGVVPTTTGVLSPTEYADVVVSVAIPSAASGDEAVTTLNATSVGDPSKSADVELTTMATFRIFLPIVLKS